jgi:hypothetical protein
MIKVPSEFLSRFDTYIKNKQIPDSIRPLYIKWLRYYFDFCKKYHFGHSRRESLPQFLEKLREKKQTSQQLQQAAQAINLYYEFIRDDDNSRSSSPHSNLSRRQGRVSTPQAQSAGNKCKERGKLITPALYGRSVILQNQRRAMITGEDLPCRLGSHLQNQRRQAS